MGFFKYTQNHAEIDYQGHKIVLNNRYKYFPLKSEMTVSLDEKIIARSNEISHVNPHIPVFSLETISETINLLEVFVIGMFSIKFAVKINGETVYQEAVSKADELQSQFFS